MTTRGQSQIALFDRRFQIGRLRSRILLILFVHFAITIKIENSSSATTGIMPHMSAHMNFEVTSGCECSCTYITFEWLITSVGSHMNLKCRTAAEMLETDPALMFGQDGGFARRGWFGLSPHFFNRFQRTWTWFGWSFGFFLFYN